MSDIGLSSRLGARSVYRLVNLPHRGRQVLGADLNYPLSCRKSRILRRRANERLTAATATIESRVLVAAGLLLSMISRTTWSVSASMQISSVCASLM